MLVSRPQQATAAALVVLGCFQAALAAGAPWGRAAYGGARRGTLPRHLRLISGVAATTYGGAAALIVRDSGSRVTRSRAFTVLAVLMGLGAIANGASRSPVERMLWTPVAAATSVLAWRSRDTEGRPRASGDARGLLIAGLDTEALARARRAVSRRSAGCCRTSP